MKNRILLVAGALLFWAAVIHSSKPQEIAETLLQNDFDQEILFGQSAFLSGAFRPYAKSIQHGIQARFERENTNGGIAGKRLRLLTLNDNGEPEKALRNKEFMQP